jgi:hypothetical protein
MEAGMANRTTNAAGIPLQTLSVEMPVELYKALRIAAAGANTNLAKFVRALLEDFIAARYAAQQPIQEQAYVQALVSSAGEEASR